MNLKRIAVLIILSLVILSTVNAIYADREYHIKDANLDLTVQKNGMLHVNESYLYSFDGTFNGVYRDIPLKPGQKIDNLHININGAYGNYTVDEQEGKAHITVYLWADKGHTQKIHDQDVEITYTYDMENVVTLYNDVGLLQFKLWGDGWECFVEGVTADIHLPGDSGNEYYLNPGYYNSSSSLNGNTIHAVSTKIPKGEFYELTALMPLDDFSSAPYANHINENGKDKIVKDISEYQSGVSFWEKLFNIFTLICLVSPFSMILVYLKYGREPKVDYDGIYEREPPTDDSPAVVNALYNSGSIGTPDMKGFESTIMDLIDRKIFKMDIESSEHTKDLILELDESRFDELSVDERAVFNLLKTFSYDNILNVSQLSSKLNNESNGKLFVEKFNQWKNIIKEQSIGEETISKYFSKRGKNISYAFVICGIIIAAIFFFMSSMSDIPSAMWTIFASVFLAVVSIALLCLPDDIFGQWTPEGRTRFLKWKNFKKFLKDYSLIKEHPPESIAVWNKYLVYGTALGVADEVYESMKLCEPAVHDDDYYYGELYRFHSYSGLIMLNSAFNTGVSAANPSSGSDGGWGGVGGGSGGGGGGAF